LEKIGEIKDEIVGQLFKSRQVALPVLEDSYLALDASPLTVEVG
jgi:hypothetical protein